MRNILHLYSVEPRIKRTVFITLIQSRQTVQAVRNYILDPTLLHGTYPVFMNMVFN